MAVLAHPDDESLGLGGTLARYAREGVATHLVTATRGQRGRCDHLEERPDDTEVGRIREAELREATRILGVGSLTILDYMDGALDQADPIEAAERIAAKMVEIRPHIVLTFDPDGAYGHPDHIAISQLTTAAVAVAASAGHAVDKLYFMAWAKAKWGAYEAAFKQLVSRVGDQVRRAQPWADWAITSVIDTTEEWPTVWKAVSAHRSQMSAYGALAELDAKHHEALWGTQSFYRAMSRVNGGPRVESDLFEGLR